MPSASPFEQQGSICYINNRASDTFGAWGCDDLFCDDELYTSVSIVPNSSSGGNNNNDGGSGTTSANNNSNNSSSGSSSSVTQSNVLGNGSASGGLVGGVHHPMSTTPHLGHSINSHQLIQQQTLNQAPLVGHHHHQQPGQPHRQQPQQHLPDHNHHHNHQHHHHQQQQQQHHHHHHQQQHHQQHHQQQQQHHHHHLHHHHQQQQLHTHLIQHHQTNTLAGSSPSGEFMAQLQPIGSSPPQCQQRQHGTTTTTTTNNNNNNANNVNNNHSTAHKTIALFAEVADARTGTWEKKLPPDWDENDATDWIFDLARKLGIPCEYFASCGTSLTGNHLLHMTEDDFQSKYPVHGREFYEAFQQLLRRIQHQGASPSSVPDSAADLVALHAGVAGGAHQSDAQLDAWSGVSNDVLHQHVQQPQLVFDRHDVDSSPYYYHHSGHAHPDAVGYGNPVAEYQNQSETYEPYLGDSFDPSENCSNETQSDPEEFTGGAESGPLSHCGAKRPAARAVAGVRQTNRRRKPDRGYGKLWEFIRDLLHNPVYCPSMVRWEDVNEGVFRIVQSEKLAALWGSIKNNPRMTYEKLSRAMRYYYKSKVFLPVLGRRLVYKFGPHAVLWKPDNPNFERPCSDAHQT